MPMRTGSLCPLFRSLLHAFCERASHRRCYPHVCACAGIDKRVYVQLATGDVTSMCVCVCACTDSHTRVHVQLATGDVTSMCVHVQLAIGVFMYS